MKQGLLLLPALLVTLFLCGCAHMYVTPNSDFLYKSVNTTTYKVAGDINIPEGKITVACLDNYEPSPGKPNTMIEENLINHLTKKGIEVIEREDHILKRILTEASGDSIQFGILTRHYSPEMPFVYDARVECKKTAKGSETTEDFSIPSADVLAGAKKFLSTNMSSTRKFGRMQGEETIVENYRDFPKEEPSVFVTYPTADYVLAYRIFECGIRYAISDKQAGYVKRIARTKLHVRLLDTNDGSIKWANTFDEMESDEIPREYLNTVEKNLYTYFGYPYPNLETREEKAPDFPCPPFPLMPHIDWAKHKSFSYDDKNPYVSGSLSLLCPGLGQMYNGEKATSLLFLTSFAGAGYTAYYGYRNLSSGDNYRTMMLGGLIAAGVIDAASVVEAILYSNWYNDNKIETKESLLKKTF